jgi:hypothetical protein
MSDSSAEFIEQSIEDPEVPIEDAIEQHKPLPGENDEDDAEEHEDFELPDEANPADVFEQHQEVGVGEDEDTHR